MIERIMFWIAPGTISKSIYYTYLIRRARSSLERLMSTAGFTNDNYIVQVSPLLELERAALPHDEAAACTFVKRRLASPGRRAPAVGGWPRTSSISEHACRLVARCRPGSGLVDREAQVNRFMGVTSVSIHPDEDALEGQRSSRSFR